MRRLRFFHDDRRDESRWFHDEYGAVQAFGDSRAGALLDQIGDSPVRRGAYDDQVRFQPDGEPDDFVPPVPFTR